MPGIHREQAMNWWPARALSFNPRALHARACRLRQRGPASGLLRPSPSARSTCLDPKV